LKTVAVALVVYFVAVPWTVALYKYLLRPGKKLRAYGEWAVVTGASDGIGKALALEFLKADMGVLLISRTASKLVEVKAELLEKTKKDASRVLCATVDFSGGLDEGKIATLKKAMEGLDIGILANNVGMSYPFTKYYQELSDAECRDLVSVNLESKS